MLRIYNYVSFEITHTEWKFREAGKVFEVIISKSHYMLELHVVNGHEVSSYGSDLITPIFFERKMVFSTENQILACSVIIIHSSVDSDVRPFRSLHSCQDGCFNTRPIMIQSCDWSDGYGFFPRAHYFLVHMMTQYDGSLWSAKWYKILICIAIVRILNIADSIISKYVSCSKISKSLETKG